jgi:hypothetical protein
MVLAGAQRRPLLAYTPRPERTGGGRHEQQAGHREDERQAAEHDRPDRISGDGQLGRRRDRAVEHRGVGLGALAAERAQADPAKAEQGLGGGPDRLGGVERPARVRDRPPVRDRSAAADP